jgi:hypothetical protein
LAIGRHFEVTFRSLARGKGIVNAPEFFRLVSGEPHPLGNFAILSNPVGLPATRTAVEPLATLTVPSAVIFAGVEVPRGVAAHLTDLGYVDKGLIPGMGIDISQLKSTALPEGYELVRVGSGPASDEWVQQFAVGYGLPLGVAQYFAPAAFDADTADDAPLQFFAIRRDDEIVATSMCYLKDGLAGVYSVSTVPSERRKGLGEHATAEPLRLAAKLGYGVGILQSSEAGYGVYKGLGFADFGGLPIYVRMPG